MMNSRATYIALAVGTLILARVLMNLVSDPLGHVREDLAQSLAEVPANAPLHGGGGIDFARIQQDITAVPTLWRPVIAPAAPPPPTRATPDLAEMLAEVRVGREQIGTAKIKVFTPEAPRGAWIEIGDMVNGCTLASFTRDEAVFAHTWAAGGATLEITLPRK